MNTLTWKKLNLGFDVFWTASMLLTDIVLLIILGFQYTSGAITNLTFFIVYFLLGSLSVLLAGLSVTYHIYHHAKRRSQQQYPGADQDVASALFLSDTTPQRFLSNPLLKLFVFVGLSVTVLLLVLLTGSIVTVPNPYAATPLDAASLHQHSFWNNAINVGIYPGFFEEAPIFHLDSIIIMTIQLMIAFVFKNPALGFSFGVFLVAVLLAVSIGATVFMVAHNTVYGLDAKAKVSAYAFDWILQFSDQFTGTFGSWLPHAANNIAVDIRVESGYAVGGQPA